MREQIEVVYENGIPLLSGHFQDHQRLSQSRSWCMPRVRNAESVESVIRCFLPLPDAEARGGG
jgi:hypothetical protein